MAAGRRGRHGPRSFTAHDSARGAFAATIPEAGACGRRAGAPHVVNAPHDSSRTSTGIGRACCAVRECNQATHPANESRLSHAGSEKLMRKRPAALALLLTTCLASHAQAQDAAGAE